LSQRIVYGFTVVGLYSQGAMENSDAGHIKCSRCPH